jgi:hypothetical protein
MFCSLHNEHIMSRDFHVNFLVSKMEGLVIILKKIEYQNSLMDSIL